MSSARFSLFFAKKRIFKIFNKESKQDSYSSKKLLEKAFPTLKMINIENKNSIALKYLNKNHMIFWTDTLFLPHSSKFYLGNNVCIHCGLSIFNYMHNLK